MKKYLIIGAALLLVVAVLATLYFTMLAPYNKVISQLKNRNWDAAIRLCRSKLMNNPDNHKYMGLQLYASMRKNYDEDMEVVIREEDESDFREINYALYNAFELPETLAALLDLEHAQYIIDNNLYTKENNPKDTVKETLRQKNREFSTNFKNATDLVKAVKYMSKVCMDKLILNNEDPVDNYYYNCFVMAQSALGNSKADGILVKKYNVDSSIATLFPYCGSGLQKPLKKLLQTNPDLSELQGAIDYLAIMKATEMINEINKKFPKAVNLDSYFLDEKAKEDEREARLPVLRAWLDSRGRKIDVINIHYNKQVTTVLKSNKMFGMDVSMLQPGEEDAPFYLSLNIYDTNGEKFVLWPYVYKGGEFTPLGIEKKNIPIVSSALTSIFHCENDGDTQIFYLGRIETRRVEYHDFEEQYNPRLNRYYDYWNDRYDYSGGYESVDVLKFYYRATLKEVAKYHLMDNKATIIEKLDDDDFDTMFYLLNSDDEEMGGDFYELMFPSCLTPWHTIK